MATDSPFRQLGFGLGLRTEHYEEVLAGDPFKTCDGSRDGSQEGAPRVDWFEAVSENFMDTGGRPVWVLEQVRAECPVALHGVGLSIGSSDAIDERYLKSLKKLVDRIEPDLVTDHLCWTGVGGRSLYDLLPLPYTEEVLAYVSSRVTAVQEYLGRRILLENASSYIDFAGTQMPEHEFLAALAERADCGILLDVNNVYVSCTNHGWDPQAYIDAIPGDRVGQMHLAGFTDTGSYLFDTHSAPVHEDVWELYRRAVAKAPQAPTLVEWDADIPDFDRLVGELDRARSEAAAALGGAPLLAAAGGAA